MNERILHVGNLRIELKEGFEVEDLLFNTEFEKKFGAEALLKVWRNFKLFEKEEANLPEVNDEI